MQPSPLQLEVNPLGTYGSHSRRSFVSDRVATPPEYLPPRPSLAAQLLSAAAPHLGGSALPPAMTYTEGLTILPAHLALAFSNRHRHAELHALPQRSLPLAARAALRADLGLPPPPTVVLAYLDRLHAIDTRTLRAWAAVLARAPESRLLLPDHPPGARANLEARFRAAGLPDADPPRLLWSAALARDESARARAMAAADLVLDCPGKSDGAVAAEARPRPLVLPRARAPRGAHALTARRAQAGLVAAPLLTLPRRKLVGRRSASAVLAAYPQQGGPPLLEEHPPPLIARNVFPRSRAHPRLPSPPA